MKLPIWPLCDHIWWGPNGPPYGAIWAICLKCVFNIYHFICHYFVYFIQIMFNIFNNLLDLFNHCSTILTIIEMLQPNCSPIPIICSTIPIICLTFCSTTLRKCSTILVSCSTVEIVQQINNYIIFINFNKSGNWIFPRGGKILDIFPRGENIQ